MGTSGTFFRLSLSLRLHVSASTPPHRQNSLTHYTISTWASFFRLPMELGCPVSRNFPHGTFHYQSRKLFFVLSRRVYSLPSASHVRIYSDFSRGSRSSTGFSSPRLLPSLKLPRPSSDLPSSLATTFGISVDFFDWY